MTIRDKMKSGRLYTDMGEGLPEERLNCRVLLHKFNNLSPEQEEERERLIKELFGRVGKNAWIEPPARLAYGKNVYIGDDFYANFNMVLVDDIDIHIGNNVMFAPNVTVTATGHPVHSELRKSGAQFSFPVTICDNVWIGSGAVILPGVTIGKNSVIGAGSVVTKDIPQDVVAVGNPCRVLRKITERDRQYYYKDLQVDTTE